MLRASPRRISLLSLLALVFAAIARADGGLTALDRYVAAPDPTYAFKLVDTVKSAGQITFILELTSQTWLSDKEVDRPVWKHWLTIVRPDTVKSTKALMLISGGSTGRPAPKAAAASLLAASASTGSVAAEVRMIPNEPLTFTGDVPRSEDAMIAYTWDKFLRTGDERWPARLPMTKAVVRAMDAVTAFCASKEGGETKIDGFVVTGASKRGWTTWTTAAVDHRVIAIIPIVIDTLNLEQAAKHHFEAYGFWAPAIKDYTDMHLSDWAGTPQNRALLKIEDPYEYRQRLTMPKFIVNAAGDQYFLPDNSQFYFDALPGPKYLRYVPNADHSLRNSDAALSVLAFYQAILAGTPLPKFAWNFQKDGAIAVTSSDRPSEVKLWQATNPKARDFRLESLGAVWKASVIDPTADGTYIGRVETPPAGFTAFCVELTFPNSSGGAPFKFTTAVRVLPDALPFKFEPKHARLETLPESRGGQDLIGKPLPKLEFACWLNTPDGKPLETAGAVTLYRYWTESCPYCEATLPAVEGLRKKYADAGLKVVAVYHPKPPHEVSDAAIAAAAIERGYHGVVAVDPKWEALKTAWLKDGRRAATSVSFLVDRNGIIRFVHPGVMYFPSSKREDAEPNSDYELINRAIAALLAER
jgi:PhoPQ-activated pathogenicity-related protein